MATLDQKIKISIIAVMMISSSFLMANLTSQTVYAATDSNDTLSMIVRFHPTDVNATGLFTVDSLTAKTTSSSICPSGNCQVSMDNQTTPTMYKFGAEYIVNANLKFTTTHRDTTTSKFYPLMVDVTPSNSIEKGGKTTYLLNGTINFGKDVVNPGMIYTVKNGTLDVDTQHHILTLYSVLRADIR